MINRILKSDLNLVISFGSTEEALSLVRMETLKSISILILGLYVFLFTMGAQNFCSTKEMKFYFELVLF